MPNIGGLIPVGVPGSNTPEEVGVELADVLALSRLVSIDKGGLLASFSSGFSSIIFCIRDRVDDVLDLLDLTAPDDVIVASTVPVNTAVLGRAKLNVPEADDAVIPSPIFASMDTDPAGRFDPSAERRFFSSVLS